MEYTLDNTIVRYSSVKSKKLLKLLVMAIIAGYFIYLIATKGVAQIIVLMISLMISFTLVGIRSRQYNPFKLIKSFFVNSSRKKNLDILPVGLDISEDIITVKLESAEYIKKQPVATTYTFKKEDITSIGIYPLDNLIEINASNVSVHLNGKSYDKTVKKGKTELFVYINDFGPDIFEKIKSYKYTYVDAQEETKKEAAYQKERNVKMQSKKEQAVEERKKLHESKDKNFIEKKIDKVNEKNPELFKTLDDSMYGIRKPEEDKTF